MKLCKHCGATTDLWPLTLDQAVVMQYLAKGYRTAEIARLLKIKSRNTVHARIWRAVEALRATTVSQALAMLAERGYFKE